MSGFVAKNENMLAGLYVYIRQHIYIKLINTASNLKQDKE